MNEAIKEIEKKYLPRLLVSVEMSDEFTAVKKSTTVFIQRFLLVVMVLRSAQRFGL
jgi:hypothetical protein